ncbi:response regulator transcription factor [Parafrankia discariae]|uniref:response regulator transcription factor n=1 Tax=Parafrankia discariae TaxID=365528 RepID=UPI0003A703E0|nr:response regulator transcription factor [Parafrankia discariae]
MVRVMVVEDEPELAGALCEALTRESFAVDVAYDGGEALKKYAAHDYDVVVLDRDLPVVHGDDVCRAIVAAQRSTRVLMLTAASAIRARVEGLAIGADDYLVKPFALAELSARVHALARRTAPAAAPILERAGLRVDQASRTVTRDGHSITLTNKEYAVLVELLRAAGGVLSAEQLLEKVWDENIDPFTNTVRMTVMKLRRKLGTPQLIETLPAAGYRIR